MDKQSAADLIGRFTADIFAFALRRTANISDAEDLSQDIALKVYTAWLKCDSVGDPRAYVKRVSRNMLANYYRTKARHAVGVPLDDVADFISDPTSDFASMVDCGEEIERLRSEIAYLSKLQREIVIAYYFENKKQSDIAAALDIPLGTVKWHLFEAKKELRKGMETTRNSSDLKFNPIKFSRMGINGTAGSRSCDDFFRSALSQNIAYCVKNQAKTISDIADDLGVSPVYVESEVEHLTEYGLLEKVGEKFIVNFIIREPSSDLLIMQDRMYRSAAKLIAPEIFDTLLSSGILCDDNIFCGQSENDLTLTSADRADNNFLMWAFVPFVAAFANEADTDKISFDEVATRRPDGGHNLFQATVMPTSLELPEDYRHMRDFCGPYNVLNGNVGLKYFAVDTEWSGLRMKVASQYTAETLRLLDLVSQDLDGDAPLSPYEYAMLAERGIMRTCGEYDGYFKTSFDAVVLNDAAIVDKLTAVGREVFARHREELESLKAPFEKLLVDRLPKHLRKMQEYENQFIFGCDGWFIVHCLYELVEDGRLKLPTEKQKKSLSTIIYRANGD